MEEIWKDIDGYEGVYQVSTFGRVKSLSRVFSFGNRGSKMKTKEKILVPHVIKNGYIQMVLSLKGKRKQVYLHRLVAAAFIHNPENKPEVNHIGGVKANTVWNLEWATKAENMLDAKNRGVMRGHGAKGEQQGMSKLTEAQVKEIRQLHNTGEYLQKELAHKFNIAVPTICQIIKRQRWAHIN